jgi:hypothetical protein
VEHATITDILITNSPRTNASIESKPTGTKPSTYLLLALLTIAALFVHGYHPFAEDAEIYLPGIERILNPHLFPVGQEFFQSHASMTLFPNLVAISIRITHVPFEWGLLLWQTASIFLFLLACWQLSCLCFESARARWAAVAMVAGLLAIPVAGTALYIIDQYLNPRNLAAFAVVFAVTRTLEMKYGRALLWLIFAACVHPLMWTYAFCFCALLIVLKHFEGRFPRGLAHAKVPVGVALLLPQIPLAPKATPAYHEAARLHAYHYIQNWAWYELLGLVAPIALFWWFGRIARGKNWINLQRLCRAFIIYDIVFIAAALVVDLPARFESLARLQPLRSLYLLYIVMFLIIGGLIGEFVLKNHVWRWCALFLPLALGMHVQQRALFPASATLEWPGRAPNNPWAEAFVWVRENTPLDAVFAIDPNYMRISGEDNLGFRCLAQRSRLADAIKDNGVVSMFPGLAERWWAEVQDQSPWKGSTLENFEHLKQKYGAGWIIMQPPGMAGLNCPHENSAVRVCRIP